MWRLAAASLVLTAGLLPALSQQADTADMRMRAPTRGVPGFPDPERGAEIALKGRGCGQAEAECSACFLCHGRAGTGNAMAPIPRISGQSFLFLQDTLRDFANGARRSAVMMPVAAGLSPDAMRDVAAYYALADPEVEFETAKAAEPGNFDASAIAAGEALATSQAPGTEFPSCVQCHGPRGIGIPPSMPSLAGQYRKYLVRRLHAFRNGARAASPSAVTHQVAQRLSDEQIDQLATNFAAQRPVQHQEQDLLPGRAGPELPPGQPSATGSRRGKTGSGGCAIAVLKPLHGGVTPAPPIGGLAIDAGRF